MFCAEPSLVSLPYDTDKRPGHRGCVAGSDQYRESCNPNPVARRRRYRSDPSDTAWAYSGDTEVHSALSLVTRARPITVQEIFDYGNYDDYEFTGKSMGFGMTADDDTPMLFLPGVITTMWGGPVRNLADQLGIELDEIRQRTEPWYTPRRIECTMATVEPGQMAAARFAVEGVRDGVPVITMEHINRLTAAAAPD
jgi:2,4-diaminopentanoate dehydrogenase